MFASIIDKDIVYNGTRVNFPTSVPQMSSVIVSVWGRNDTATPLDLGVSWTVRDPNGAIVQQYDRWTSWLLKAGGIHGFEGGYITALIPGTYTIDITLMADSAQQIVADAYSGPLCDVIGELEDFVGIISDRRFLYNDEPAAFGSDMMLGTTITVKIQGQNQMSTTQDMSCHWQIRNPIGVLVQEFSLDYWDWGIVPPSKFIRCTGQPLTLDREGEWTIDLELLMNPADPIAVDSWQGILVRASIEEPPPPPPPPPPPDDDGISIVPILLGGAAIVAIAFASKKKKS